MDYTVFHYNLPLHCLYQHCCIDFNLPDTICICSYCVTTPLRFTVTFLPAIPVHLMSMRLPVIAKLSYLIFGFFGLVFFYLLIFMFIFLNVLIHFLFKFLDKLFMLENTYTYYSQKNL